MPLEAITIPQLGEGLQEARLIRFLKQPGDSVKRDEPLFEMETDKAVTEVESPYAGTLKEWLVEEDTVLEIGAEIGKMQTSDDAVAIDAPVDPVVEETGQVETLVTASARRPRFESKVPIPPRTRRYLRAKGLEDVVDEIPAAGKRLTEEDIDRYLAGRTESSEASSSAEGESYTESELPTGQQTLNYRMARGAQVVIPAVLETDLDWRMVQACREQTRESGGPTSFAMVLWCVTQAMRDHPALRSSLSSDGKMLRTYSRVNLGVAVALPGDELKTAVVANADTLTQAEFFANLANRIEAARNGQDQVDATTTVSVSNIGATDMRSGIPVVVAPAVATLAVGQVRPVAVPDKKGILFQPSASITMSFDHRVMNGIGAASFLGDIRRLMAEFTLE